MILAIDFDGTLCKNQYPKIGTPNKPLIHELIKRKQNGDTLILWTCREGEMLKEAIAWLKKQGLTFDHFNQNTQASIKKFGSDSRKVYADEYWDDKAIQVMFSQREVKEQMPICKDREYRTMTMPLTIAAEGTAKRFNTEYYVEGFATTFNTPYVLYECDGIKFYELIDRNALSGADMSDVIMQYNHAGTVFARNKMAVGKPPSLLIEPQDSGLFIAADLGLTNKARGMFEDIDKGLIYKMSWAFRVASDAYDKDTRTRTILKIEKVYDVSAVSHPANAATDITARSYFDGVIEAERREALARRRELLTLKLLLED